MTKNPSKPPPMDDERMDVRTGYKAPKSAFALIALLLTAASVVKAQPPPMVDGDADGVPDEIDLCPYTPPGTAVDSTGCPITANSDADADADGVPDDRDDCPYTPRGARVDVHGCAIDSDFDGVPDGIDRCPSTPFGEAVDDNGCARGETPRQNLPASRIAPAFRPAPASAPAPVPAAPPPVAIVPPAAAPVPIAPLRAYAAPSARDVPNPPSTLPPMPAAPQTFAAPNPPPYVPSPSPSKPPLPPSSSPISPSVAVMPKAHAVSIPAPLPASPPVQPAATANGCEPPAATTRPAPTSNAPRNPIRAPAAESSYLPQASMTREAQIQTFVPSTPRRSIPAPSVTVMPGATPLVTNSAPTVVMPPDSK